MEPPIQANTGFQQRHQFNPNDARYINCCRCNVKSFTLGFAIVEIFITCFLVVAIVPEMSSKICVNRQAPLFFQQSPELANQTEGTGRLSWNSTDTASTSVSLSAAPEQNNFSSQQDQKSTPGEQQLNVNRGLSLIHRMACLVNMGWLALAIVHITATNLMFYGMKSQRWTLFLPHLFTRTFCLALCTSLITMLVAACMDPLPPNVHIGVLIATIILLTATSTGMLYLIKCEIRCCEFVRSSAETGFFLSNTHRIGPATMSQSDSTRAHASRRGATKRQTTPSAPHVDQNNNQNSNENASEGAERGQGCNDGDISPRVEVRSEDAVATFQIVAPTSLPPLRHTYK